ncbi:MAG: recombinase family protein [Pseudomonadota bacterium]
MERPALTRLLADIERGFVDVIVVYKIDRLSRSLADFSRMVEIFDRRGVSFVSITRAFNTTNSMGRLTLNMLLSFAQFEREVTGERIRDKMAASKRKGMWMGGNLPLGYDAPGPDDPRALQVNPHEAETVRHISRTYLELRSVHRLMHHLAVNGITSKAWTTRKGNQRGGKRLGRGALFYLLRNKTYIGLTPQGDDAYEGQHTAIIRDDVFAEVQSLLDSQAMRQRTTRTTARAPLTGKLFDASGQPMTPTHARGKSGKIYRYYVSASLLRGQKNDSQKINMVRRISARAIEDHLQAVLSRIINEGVSLEIIGKVTLEPRAIRIELSDEVLPIGREQLAGDELILGGSDSGGGQVLLLPTPFSCQDGQIRITAQTHQPEGPDPAIVKALRQAHGMLSWDRDGQPAASEAPASPHHRKLVKLALLAPDIQHALLTRAPPQGLTLSKLLSMDLPLCWAAQRRTIFGR